MYSEPDWDSDFGGRPEQRKFGRLLTTIRDRLSIHRVKERLKVKRGFEDVDPPMEAIAEAPSQAAEVLAFKPPKPSV